MRNCLGYRVAVFVAIFGAAVAIAREPSVEFQVIADPGFRSSKPVYAAIHSQVEWVAFWNSWKTDSATEALTVNSGPPPMIDFKKFTLLVASSGTKPNLGYSLAFASIRKFNGVITVSVLDIGPGPNCPTLQEITNPRIFALIPKSSERVEFTVLRSTLDCRTREQIP